MKWIRSAISNQRLIFGDQELADDEQVGTVADLAAQLWRNEGSPPPGAGERCGDGNEDGEGDENEDEEEEEEDIFSN